MMIKLTPFATGPREYKMNGEMNGEVIIREVADVEIVGYIVAVHDPVEANALRYEVLPANIQFFTVDIVVSPLPAILSRRRYEFTYDHEKGIRSAQGRGWGLDKGKERQLHLSTSLDVQFFQALIGRRVRIVGTEVAVNDQAIGKTFCWFGPLMADLLGEPVDSTLRASLAQNNLESIRLGGSQCHSMSLRQIEAAPLFHFFRRTKMTGKEASGNFTAAAAASSAAGSGAVNGAQSKIAANNKAKQDGLRAQKNDEKMGTVAAAAQKYLDGGGDK